MNKERSKLFCTTITVAGHFVWIRTVSTDSLTLLLAKFTYRSSSFNDAYTTLLSNSI